MDCGAFRDHRALSPSAWRCEPATAVLPFTRYSAYESFKLRQLACMLVPTASFIQSEDWSRFRGPNGPSLYAALLRRRSRVDRPIRRGVREGLGQPRLRQSRLPPATLGHDLENPERWLPRRFRDRKPPTDPFGQQVRNLDMTRDRFRVTGLWILPERVLLAFAPNHATVSAKVAQQRITLHPTTTSSCFASGGRDRSDSSRRCSRMRAIACLRLSRHSSRVLPCPFAPGTSAQ